MLSKNFLFLTYSGDWPNLCSGTLMLGTETRHWVFNLGALIPGGSVSFDDNWTAEVTEGPWGVSEWPEGFPEELKEEALEVINENIRWGCCGGCL